MNNYSIKIEKKENSTGEWNSNIISIYNDKDVKIGEYTRHYPSFTEATFHPFVYKGKDYALFSSDYTKTSVMTLPDCKVIAEEPNNSFGFCPVDFYVPIDPRNNESGGFGFVAGCVWGDDSDWKIEFLDLREIEKGIIKRDNSIFGYAVMAEGRLKDSIIIDDYDWTEDEGEPLIRIKTMEYGYAFNYKKENEGLDVELAKKQNQFLQEQMDKIKKEAKYPLLKHIGISWVITTMLYTIIYLFKSFIVWNLTNPFQWIINIPTYDGVDRFMILFFVLFYLFMNNVVSYNIVTKGKLDLNG